jgi:hypothetical protein
MMKEKKTFAISTLEQEGRIAMPLLEPVILPDGLSYELSSFRWNEVRKFYIETRRRNCTYMQIMDLWLVVPTCYGCALDQSLDSIVRPFIAPSDWEAGIRAHVGESVLRMTKRQIGDDPDFAYRCKSCCAEVRPWGGDQMSVSHLHLEEHFNIPLEIHGHRKPSASLTKLIHNLYGNRCFGCGLRRTPKRRLHTDHVIPQSNGGTSAFRNLQPLCEACGNRKGNHQPDEVVVYSAIFFEPYPSDSRESMFGA